MSALASLQPVSPVPRRDGIRYRGSSIGKSFSGAMVLHSADVSFEPGEIHTLCGQNGAGKSTLLKIMAGVYQPDSGQLDLGGTPLPPLTPKLAQQHGIYLVPQEPTLLPHLSVAENLFVGVLPRRRIFVDWARIRREAEACFERIGLDIAPNLRAGELSIAQQQLLECARALVHRCEVLFFDEPTSPLTEHEARVLFEVMAAMRDEGTTIGFISHRLDEVELLSDRVTVLRDGQIVARLTRANLDRTALVAAIVGHEVVERTQKMAAAIASTSRPARLELEGLTLTPHFSGIDLVVHEGEVVGLAGLVGSGRTEIAETVFGLRQAEHGVVRVNGNPLEHRSPRRCIDAGLVYLPEDRGRHGIFADVDIVRNVTAGIIPRLPRRGGLLRRPVERELAKAAAARTDVRTVSLEAAIRTLSGGNQQRAMFARWLAAGPSVAIFDEPTRGVDVGAKDDIYDIITELAADGLACLIISSELEELAIICTRVLAIYEGRIVGELVGKEITTARMGELVVGAGAR